MIDVDALALKVAEVELDEVGTEEADGMSPYGVAKVVNQVLRAVGSTRADVTPQMMYQYAKSGRINGVKGAKRFTEDEVETFVARWVAKNK